MGGRHTSRESIRAVRGGLRSTGPDRARTKIAAGEQVIEFSRARAPRRPATAPRRTPSTPAGRRGSRAAERPTCASGQPAALLGPSARRCERWRPPAEAPRRRANRGDQRSAPASSAPLSTASTSSAASPPPAGRQMRRVPVCILAAQLSTSVTATKQARAAAAPTANNDPGGAHADHPPAFDERTHRLSRSPTPQGSTSRRDTVRPQAHTAREDYSHHDPAPPSTEHTFASSTRRRRLTTQPRPRQATRHRLTQPRISDNSTEHCTVHNRHARQTATRPPHLQA